MLYLRVIINRQSRPAQILLPDCVSCLNLDSYRRAYRKKGYKFVERIPSAEL